MLCAPHLLPWCAAAGHHLVLSPVTQCVQGSCLGFKPGVYRCPCTMLQGEKLESAAATPEEQAAQEFCGVEGVGEATAIVLARTTALGGSRHAGLESLRGWASASGAPRPDGSRGTAWRAAACFGAAIACLTGRCLQTLDQDGRCCLLRAHRGVWRGWVRRRGECSGAECLPGRQRGGAGEHAALACLAPAPGSENSAGRERQVAGQRGAARGSRRSGQAQHRRGRGGIRCGAARWQWAQRRTCSGRRAGSSGTWQRAAGRWQRGGISWHLAASRSGPTRSGQPPSAWQQRGPGKGEQAAAKPGQGAGNSVCGSSSGPAARHPAEAQLQEQVVLSFTDEVASGTVGVSPPAVLLVRLASTHRRCFAALPRACLTFCEACHAWIDIRYLNIHVRNEETLRARSQQRPPAAKAGAPSSTEGCTLHVGRTLVSCPARM